MTEEAMIKPIAVISALSFALSPISAVYAQSAASVVTNATSDATIRAVTEAVQRGHAGRLEVQSENRSDEVSRHESAG